MKLVSGVVLFFNRDDSGLKRSFIDLTILVVSLVVLLGPLLLDFLLFGARNIHVNVKIFHLLDGLLAVVCLDVSENRQDPLILLGVLKICSGKLSTDVFSTVVSKFVLNSGSEFSVTLLEKAHIEERGAVGKGVLILLVLGTGSKGESVEFLVHVWSEIGEIVF
jgi:hypothetical protein